MGLSGKDIAKQSKTLKSVKGRLELLKCKDFHIIDDTYNSNPDSLGNALRAVSGIGNDKTKFLILGDMFELGEDAPKFHTAAGKMINKIKHVEVYTIGKNSKKINEALKGNIIQKHFATRNSLLKFIDKMDFHGSVVLVKGSRGMHMEDFVNEIKDRA